MFNDGIVAQLPDDLKRELAMTRIITYLKHVSDAYLRVLSARLARYVAPGRRLPQPPRRPHVRPRLRLHRPHEPA